MMHQVFTSLMAPIRYDALSARLGQYVTQIGLLVVSITSPVTLNSTVCLCEVFASFSHLETDSVRDSVKSMSMAVSVTHLDFFFFLFLTVRPPPPSSANWTSKSAVVVVEHTGDNSPFLLCLLLYYSLQQQHSFPLHWPLGIATRIFSLDSWYAQQMATATAKAFV